MADTPNWKYRRLASRALRIQERRAPESAPIKAYGTSLVPLGQAFIAAYDGATKYETAWKKEMKEGRGAVSDLLKQIRSWAPVVQGAVPTLNISGLGDKPDVPDDVILDAEMLLGEAAGITLPNGDPAPFAAEIQTTLGAALEKAEKEWAEAEAADSTYQSLLAKVRETVGPFSKVLVQFRRTLAAVAGRQDKDFQKIRAERAGGPDDEDDTNAGSNAPAAGGTGAPAASESAPQDPTPSGG